MFYVFRHTITTSDIITAKKEMELQLTDGVVHQVDFLFEDGCNHDVHIQVFKSDFQVWPSNRGESLTGNATLISFRDYYEIKPGNTDLTAKIWADGTIEDVEVVIQIGLLPKHVLMPISFEELLKAARGY